MLAWHLLTRRQARALRLLLLDHLPSPPAALRRCPPSGPTLARACSCLAPCEVLGACLAAGVPGAALLRVLAGLSQDPGAARWRGAVARAVAASALPRGDQRVIVAIAPGWDPGPHRVGGTLAQALADGAKRQPQLRRLARGDLMVRAPD